MDRGLRDFSSMKRILSFSFAVGLLALLPSCIAVDPSMMGPGPGGGGYNGGGGYSGRSDYRDRGYDDRGDYCPPTRPSPGYGHGHDAHSGHDDHGSGRSNYFGGPDEWYRSGVGIGRRDRREHKSDSYQRHSSHFDSRTRSEFSRGYHDGYHGH
jgi:hypothetical protein